MINVNQITSVLSKLPDQALQQYANANKNNPYTLSLAVAEANRRRQMREGAQLNSAISQGRPESVVDQQISQISALPENSGIAQLPTGDMEYADGGIVAFADGGDVPRYAPGGWLDSLIYGGITPAERARRERLQAAAEAAAKERAVARGDTIQQERDRNLALVNDAAVPFPADYRRTDSGLPRVPGGEAPYAGPYLSGREQLGLAATGVSAIAPPAVAAEQTAPAAPRGAPAGAAPAGGIAALQPSGLLGEYNNLLSQLKDPNDPNLRNLDDISAQNVALAREQEQGIKDINAKHADIFSGAEGRLNKRELGLGKMKDESLGLALLQAGAAMMSTPGKWGAAMGAGVAAGTKAHAAGLEKLRIAQEKIDEARDKLDILKSQRGEMSERELLKAKGDVSRTLIAGAEARLKYIMDTEKVDRATAVSILSDQIKMSEGAADRASRERIEGAKTALLRDRYKKQDNDEAKLRTEYGKIQTAVTAALKTNPEYQMAKDDAARTALFNAEMRRQMAANPFLAPYAANIGFVGASSGKKHSWDGDDGQ